MDFIKKIFGPTPPTPQQKEKALKKKQRELEREMKEQAKYSQCIVDILSIGTEDLEGIRKRFIDKYNFHDKYWIFRIMRKRKDYKKNFLHVYILASNLLTYYEGIDLYEMSKATYHSFCQCKNIKRYMINYLGKQMQLPQMYRQYLIAAGVVNKTGGIQVSEVQGDECPFEEEEEEEGVGLMLWLERNKNP